MAKEDYGSVQVSDETSKEKKMISIELLWELHQMRKNGLIRPTTSLLERQDPPIVLTIDELNRAFAIRIHKEVYQGHTIWLTGKEVDEYSQRENDILVLGRWIHEDDVLILILCTMAMILLAIITIWAWESFMCSVSDMNSYVPLPLIIGIPYLVTILISLTRGEMIHGWFIWMMPVMWLFIVLFICTCRHGAKPS